HDRRRDHRAEAEAPAAEAAEAARAARAARTAARAAAGTAARAARFVRPAARLARFPAGAAGGRAEARRLPEETAQDRADLPLLNLPLPVPVASLEELLRAREELVPGHPVVLVGVQRSQQRLRPELAHPEGDRAEERRGPEAEPGRPLERLARHLPPLLP